MKKLSTNTAKFTRRQRLEALIGHVGCIFTRRLRKGLPVAHLKSRAACLSRLAIAAREADELSNPSCER